MENMFQYNIQWHKSIYSNGSILIKSNTLNQNWNLKKIINTGGKSERFHTVSRSWFNPAIITGTNYLLSGVWVSNTAFTVKSLSCPAYKSFSHHPTVADDGWKRSPKTFYFFSEPTLLCLIIYFCWPIFWRRYTRDPYLMPCVKKGGKNAEKQSILLMVCFFRSMVSF